MMFVHCLRRWHTIKQTLDYRLFFTGLVGLAYPYTFPGGGGGRRAFAPDANARNYHETLNHCWVDVGLSSPTLAQHYPYSAGTDFSRLNVTSVDVRF